jgi:hypothetical protein
VSALADALVAAQFRAVAALGKQYVGGTIDADTVRADLESVGLTDEVDVTRLIAAWDILHSAGAPAPSEQSGNGKVKDEAATDAQLTLVRKLAQEKNQQVPDGPFTKAQAHEIIDTMKAGTYDKPFPKSAQLARGERRYRRKVASPKQWQAIIAAKNGPCRVCEHHFYAMQYHHLIARIHGGGDAPDNIVPLCGVCHALVTAGRTGPLRVLAGSLTDSERAYVVGKLGEDGLSRLFGATR